MANVSPGVFTKIIDLSSFIQAVPSTIGFLTGFTRKGRDNELVLANQILQTLARIMVKGHISLIIIWVNQEHYIGCDYYQMMLHIQI